MAGTSGARFAAAVATHASTPAAIEAVCAATLRQLDRAADLAVLFVTHHHRSYFQHLAGEVCTRLGTESLIGCTGESLVADGREIEQQPAVALWLAHWPGTTTHLMHLAFERTSEGGSFAGFPDALAGDWPTETALVLLGEPYSFPADVLLERMNEDRPGVPIVGGMASGAHAPGENRLFLGRAMHDAGAVAAAIHGGVRLRWAVSQGCRPIGRPLVITKAERNVIFELGGKPALAVLEEIYRTLSADDQQRLQHGLHVGRVTNEYQDSFRRGDFLIRNVVGFDRDAGAIAIGDYARAGQTVQFHLRDAASADEDLRELTAGLAQPESSRGALLFTCNGRGTRLFDEPHHDAGVVQQTLGPIPTAGFFAQGEIGPVGGKNFLHGFTASVAVFEPTT